MSLRVPGHDYLEGERVSGMRDGVGTDHELEELRLGPRIDDHNITSTLLID